MRVNVYSQELTSHHELVRSEGKNDAGEPAVFYGIRLYLESAPTLHYTAEDDDRSAVTLWLPKSAHRIEALAMTLESMAEAVRELLP